MSGVPYTFANATTTIALSNLDANFNTPVTIGNTTVGLGNTVTTLGNVTLAGATVSGGSANGVVYLNTSNVASANASVLAFDGSNLGVGVTPSAWGSTWKGIQFKSSPNFLSGGTDLNVLANAYNDGTNYKYIDSFAYASRYYQYNGQHQWHTTTSTQGAGNTISFTQAMILNNSGLLENFSSTDGIHSRNSNTANNANSLFVGFYGATSISNGTLCFNVTTNGNVTNTNNSYGAISDAKLKQNVSLSGSQWNDVKALGSLVKKYSLIADTTNTMQIGWIAQDVQTVSPKLIYSTPDKDEQGNLIGTETLGVNYSVAYMKAFKALSEAQVRIETLESTVATLQAAVTALQAKVGV